MARPSNFFTHLDGVVVQYDRHPLGVYGVSGKNYRFHCLKSFEDQLAAFVADLRTKTEPLYGPMIRILSAGAYVNKPKMHGKGRAFDLDAIHWREETLVADQQPLKKTLYLLVQTIAYRHFGMVLAYNYDAAHKDHFHLDDSREVKFRESKSATYFMQEVVNHFYGAEIAIDGDYGNETEEALEDVFKEFNVAFPPDKDGWLAFLDAVETEALDRAHLERGYDDDPDDDDVVGSPPVAADIDEDDGVPTSATTLAIRVDTGRIDTTYAPEPGWQVIRNAGRPDKWYLERTGKPRLYLGYEYEFGRYTGLARTGGVRSSAFYDHRDYEAKHGLWAPFLVPTGKCESEGNFFVVNAWDSAAITLGFFQMAAHTGEHLADLFRDLLEALPDEADTYFPEIKLGKQIGFSGSEARRLFAVNGSDRLDLDEPAQHPDGLHFRSYDRGRFMAFFNPDRGKTDLEEAVTTARWIAWLQGSEAARNVIVDNAVAISKRAVEKVHKLALAANMPQLPDGLDGIGMDVVQAAMDTKHHGRRHRDRGWSTDRSILHALSMNDPLSSFRAIDTGWREDRAKRNVDEIQKMKPIFDGKVLNTSKIIFE